MRNAVCKHMMENKQLFQPFVDDKQFVESYMFSTQMTQEGTWATEVVY